MSESVLPALRHLGGRRQVILATQDANFVVHADPAQIIVLEADADRGRVALEGALEEPTVREAVVQIVAGGEGARGDGGASGRGSVEITKMRSHSAPVHHTCTHPPTIKLRITRTHFVAKGSASERPPRTWVPHYRGEAGAVEVLP